MLRKIGFTLLCAAGMLSTPAFSTTNVILTPGLSLEYELKPNNPITLANILYWTIKANCTINSHDLQTPLSVTMLRKTGSVNDITLTTNQLLELVVHSGENLKITAESGAKVELVNHGENLVTATCSTV